MPLHASVTPVRRMLGWGLRLLRPIVDMRRALQGVPRYVVFFQDWLRYRRMDTSSSATLMELYPKIHQKGHIHGLNAHYFYQSAWAFRLITGSQAKRHVDVGSETTFAGLLSTVIELDYVDIRALQVNLENFHSKSGDIVSLPYPDDSVQSLSSLHVIEHIGLGRYGDPIDPDGTAKAARELSRILAPGGNLYVSLPIGRPRVRFNSERMHSVSSVVEMFKGLELVEFSSVSDSREFVRSSDMDAFGDARNSCGLFWFRKGQGAGD